MMRAWSQQSYRQELILTSEGADAAVGPSSNTRKAIGDPADELVCDASQPAHQVDVEYLQLANTVCNAYHVEHKSP